MIATLQIKDVFALPIAHMPDSYVEKLEVLWAAHGQASLPDFAIAATTLALLVGLPKLAPGLTRRAPAPLIAIALVTGAATWLHHDLHGFAVATIGSRFHAVIGGRMVNGIPSLPPTPMLPWSGQTLSLHALRDLASAAFAIAMLGAIESLLSAVIADGMTGKKHDPDAELVGLGIGNMLVPFFGGIAATGALARTATNVRAGAARRSPRSSMRWSCFSRCCCSLRLLRTCPWLRSPDSCFLSRGTCRRFVTSRTRWVAPKSDVFVLSRVSR